jgi:hypothetical protein
MSAKSWRVIVAVVALAALVALDTSCFGERRGLSRDALLSELEETKTEPQLPSVGELAALRVPEPPPRPAEVDAAKPTRAVEQAELAIAKGDIAGAEKIWNANGNDADVLAHRCLVEGILRRYDFVVDACGKFLDKAPFDPKAVAALRTLTKAKLAVRAAGQLVDKRGSSWIASCANADAKCSDLAFLVALERTEQARIDKDERGFGDAVVASGRLRRAIIDGPYEGDVRSDFLRDAKGEPQKPQEPLFHTQRFVDEDGLFAPSLRGPDGLYRLRFAGTAAKSTHATVYVTGVHAARVRVDGVVVAERPVDGSVPAVTRASIELAPGTHTVDVLAWSTGRGDDLSVAFLRDNGSPALDEVADFAAIDAARASGVKTGAPEGAAEALTAGVASEPGASSDTALLTKLMWRTTIARAPAFGVDPDEGRQIATELVGKFGWSPPALAVAAELVGDDHSVPERVASSSAARLWSKVRAAWPDHPVARIAEARDFKEERPDEALAAYRALVKANPRYPFGHRELIDVALDAGLVDEARASADALLAIDHGPENIDAALPALKAAAQMSEAAKLEDERAALDDSFASTRTARRLLERGDTDAGLAALDKAAHAERGSPALEEWIDLLALRAPRDALAAVERALGDFPNDPSLQLKRAQLLAAVDGDAKAKAELVAALPHIRESDSAARYAEELGVGTEWDARLALGDDVIARRRAMSSAPFPGHPAVALLDDAERDVFEDDSSLSIRHLIIELRTKEILDRFGEFSLGEARLIRLRVVKPDGSVVERERHKGVDDVSLPQLGEGDVVELLTAERDAPPHMGGAFETRELDGSPTPALSRRYVLSFPDGYEAAHSVAIVAKNGLAQPARDNYVDGEGKKRTRYVFALENVPATTGEPYTPNRAETAKVGGYAWGVDAALWSRLRGITVELAAQKSAWLEASAKKIAGAGNDDDKLRRIFAFVARKIEPADTPDDAEAVLASSAGQRTPLLLALLRGAGLDADPVALQLPTQPDPSTYDLSSWSSIAVRVRIAGKEHFAVVDNNAVLDLLPPVAKGARVLDLTLASSSKETGSITALPDDVVDEVPVRVQVDLAMTPAASADAPSLNGLIVVTIPASKADGARRGVRRATAEQLRTVVERAFAASLPGVSVLDVKTPDLERAGEPLRIGAKVSVPLPVGSGEGDATNAGRVRFDHLFADGASGGLGLTSSLASYLQVSDRKIPMLVVADDELLEVQLTLPPTAAFVEAPEPLALAAGPFALDQKVTIEDGKLYWRREISKRNARIPIDAWPGVRVTLAGLAARSDARLSFVVSRSKSDTARKQAQLDQNR